ncbi:heavy metal-associated isoprenylated plant protein 39-like isoform X2 [Punica granatum]|uniref:Heavy metal-associated isoprenylated plant protein 39-like isoform X2 n=2 Tax=Punica granatum TaxID=22663 RepID=A0A6P8DD65_PUNGR|nr:heavy metal-associated isoprenylated plant protein 39-like isoform X2 [Punica granatum]XP_031394510.1 heavy metal-associated isoprenylated plant protein 39-like isoform X2 [Punica granatum]
MCMQDRPCLVVPLSFSTFTSSDRTNPFLLLPLSVHQSMDQKVVLKVLTMTDDKTKQKAIEAAADIYGVTSIAADMKEQKLTVIGQMDTVAVVKKLKKVGKVDIISVGPAKEEKKEEKKDSDKKDADKKDANKKDADKKSDKK